jgi:hypothetical protein
MWERACLRWRCVSDMDVDWNSRFASRRAPTGEMVGSDADARQFDIGFLIDAQLFDDRIL